MKKSILLMFLFTFGLIAQTGWSDAKQLSRNSNYPYLGFWHPSITVDREGTIHAFWVVNIYINGSTIYDTFAQIEYRKSTDGGLTWSTTENITPVYTDLRIYEIEAVCDSKNHIHITYMRGFENCKIMHKTFDGTNWSEPVEVSPYSNINHLLGIDSEDRLFIVFDNGLNPYFCYCDLNDSNPQWTYPTRIGVDECFFYKFTYNTKNDVLLTGSKKIPDGTSYKWRPCLCKYTKSMEEWTSFEEIYDFKESLTGCAIACDNEDKIYINMSLGSYDVNLDYHITKMDDSALWSEPYVFGDSNNSYREMFLDNENYLHLFELHYFDSDPSYGDIGLIHSTGKNGVWNTDVIDSTNQDYSFSEPNVAYDKINNRLYILYTKFSDISKILRVFFRSKQNDTGIENTDDNLTENFRLYQNYPNPFNNSTNIKYSINQSSNVKISLYSIKGEFILNLINERQTKGHHSLIFNASDLNSGIYYYQIETDGEKSGVKKMLYLK